MPLSFLNPALLWGLGFASIPIIIHLLQRRRQRIVRWGAMEFLLLSVKTMEATNSGPIMGMPATGKPIKMDGIDITRWHSLLSLRTRRTRTSPADRSVRVRVGFRETNVLALSGSSGGWYRMDPSS